METVTDRLELLKTEKQKVSYPSGKNAADKQHKKGKLTARERINLLCDKGTFTEINGWVKTRFTDFDLDKKAIYSDGVITGYGLVNGRITYIYAQDFTSMGGSLGEMHALKITRLQELAVQNGAPFIGLNDSGGARIQEGVASLAGFASIFYRNTMASGVIPQISAIMGPCAGGAVYSPAITDFTIMTKNSYMFVTGPNVVKEVTNEDLTFEELGGNEVHSGTSGVTHFVAEDEYECIELIKQLLSYLPQNNLEDPPYMESGDSPLRICEELNTIIPDNNNKPYDMIKLISTVLDNGSFFEIHRNFAQNVIVGLGRLGGHVAGIVANNPSVLAGVLDINASVKAARFIRFCDAFNIPIISFVDVPGFLPGLEQESNGIIRHGAKMLFAYSEATVPKLAVITRKAYGGAYCVMSSKQIGSDYNLAWPTAEIAVMGAKGACNIIFKKEIDESADPRETVERLSKDFNDRFLNPYIAAKLAYIDDIIEPCETRLALFKSLEANIGKRQTRPARKHGNIPL
ncbi:MAG: acyl-CoA carboxylase subunit beta [Oligoflexia bacterium]|nr:acyl-CoA carboxylase subunit beta [Oligoflexia bacterium]